MSDVDGPPPPPSGPPGPPPPPEIPSSTRPAWVVPAAIFVILGVAVGLIVGLSSTGGASNKTAKSTGEIFLQPASDPGPDPFGPSAAAPLTPSQSPSNPATGPAASATSSTTGSTSLAPSSAASATSGPLVLSAKSGGTPGLYGGSNRLSVCDKAAMIAYLEATPSKASAWAAAQGISVSDLPGYITKLTPVVLRSDTRVTNHGYAKGRATAFQAILQAGTAVLVDEFGVPRARCACGNPLAAPVAVPTTPNYQGPAWPGFTPTNVTVINKSTTVINVITVINIETGQPLGIPVNPGGGPTGSPAATASASGSPSSSAVAGKGWHLKTVKFVPLLGQPDYTMSPAWTATGGGVRLTLHDNGTLCGGTGGSETVNLSWSFGRDITDLANGDTFPATVNAAKVSASGTCTTGLAARSGLTIGTSSGGSLPATAFDTAAEPERFSGATLSAAPDTSEGSAASASATLSVTNTPSDPSRPESGFVATIQGPGVEFFILYLYEQD
jgi:hypothetical protein